MRALNTDLLLNGFNTFLVTLDGENYTVIAKSRSSAVYKAFIKSGMCEITTYKEFIFNRPHVKTKKKGRSRLEDMFMNDDTLNYCRRYRNMPFLKLGMKIEIQGGEEAYIIGGSDIIEYYVPRTNSFGRDHPGSIKFLDD